jgi:hypothetical protein
MASLITALLGTAALLLGLWALIMGGWWLALRLIDPLLERSRTSVQQERILRHHQALERQRQALARDRDRQRLQVVDLDGQVCWLLPEQIPAFHRRCWAELGLPEGSPWPVVRQHWRRSSLRWHPDHGGDPALWLRKQRAYGALDKARAQARGLGPGLAQPRQLSGRRRPWPWRGKPPRSTDQ